MLRKFLTHIISSSVAIFLSLKYLRTLNIRPKEYPRYFIKASNLALCYIAFTKSNSTRVSYLAGVAGFLCCSYDVVTDWRNFDKTYYKIYLDILNQNAEAELVDLTKTLYEKETKANLKFDGLERGIVAFKFVTKMLGTFEYYKSICDVDKVGMLLQIGDDILDYEKDLNAGDLNCLLTTNKNYYLEVYVKELTLDVIKKLFRNGIIFSYVIKKSLNKANLLLEKNNKELIDKGHALIYNHSMLD